MLLEVVQRVVIVVDDVPVEIEVESHERQIGMIGVAGVGVADADSLAASYVRPHGGESRVPAKDVVDPPERRVERAGHLLLALLLRVALDRNVGLDLAEPTGPGQAHGRFVAVARVLLGGNGCSLRPRMSISRLLGTTR